MEATEINYLFKMIKNKILKLLEIVSIVALISNFLLCSTNGVHKGIPASIDEIENRFFTMDFENDKHELSNLKDQFFTTFPHDDPTEGDVVYDREKWINDEMIRIVKGDGVYLYVRDRDDDKGFDSVRLTSKAYYNLNEATQKILFVFKGEFPSAKGMWPAWWLNGSKQDSWTYEQLDYVETDNGLDKYSGKGHFYDTPSAVNPTDWPAAGEIDIIETINGENLIHNTIHTCPQMCNSEWNDDNQIINCANAIPGDPNSGCSGKAFQLRTPEGTFACLWEKDNIQFYYWKPSENVRRIGGPLSNDPDPDLWREENLMNEVKLLETDTECDEHLHQAWQCKSCETSNSCSFINMKMIFNTTLCGKWAGNKFDDTDNSLTNCRELIMGQGKQDINNQFLKIEYVSVRKLK